MLNHTSSLSLRLLLMGGVPLIALLTVLLLSYQASISKDKLFNRLYSEHLILLEGLLSTLRLLEPEALGAVEHYRSGWLSESSSCWITCSIFSVLV